MNNREKQQRLNSMLAVDFKRAFISPFLYIMIGISFVMPILILVMTTMVGTTPEVANAEASTMDTFSNVWQIISTVSGSEVGAGMSLTSMCNINMLYFIVAVFICTFISDDFRSGYCKNLFTVRARKINYVISKTVIGFVGGALMFIAFFIGALIGGKIAGLSFDMTGFGMSGVTACMLSKILLIPIFVAIFVLMSVIGKQRLWMSILCSLCVGMLFFMMIPMMTPLDATMMHVGLTLVGGALFSVGLGTISNLILKKISILI